MIALRALACAGKKTVGGGKCLPFIMRNFCNQQKDDRIKDLWDSHGIVLSYTGKYKWELSEIFLTYLYEKEDGDCERLGTVELSDVWMINVRTTNWGPMANDIYYDIFDSKSRVVIGGKTMFIPLIIDQVGDMNLELIRGIADHGFKINMENLNGAFSCKEHKNFPIYFNEKLFLEQKQPPEHDKDEREEIARRIHYLYRSFFLGLSNFIGGLEASPVINLKNVKPTLMT